MSHVNVSYMSLFRGKNIFCESQRHSAPYQIWLLSAGRLEPTEAAAWNSTQARHIIRNLTVLFGRIFWPFWIRFWRLIDHPSAALFCWNALNFGEAHGEHSSAFSNAESLASNWCTWSRIRFTKKHSKCSNYQCLWAVSMRVAPPTRISPPPIHLDENLGLACWFLVNCGQRPPETFMPGTRWRWISACTSYHTCRNPEMRQPSLPRRWLKREAAEGPPGRDIPDNLWLASGKNRRFNSKGISKMGKNSAWRCIRYRWSLPTKTTNLSNQSIGKVPSFEFNSWHGYNFVHLFVSHLLEANETLVCVCRGARKLGRTGRMMRLSP